jgi:peptide/nickel transport system substrate-binding protein
MAKDSRNTWMGRRGFLKGSAATLGTLGLGVARKASAQVAQAPAAGRPKPSGELVVGLSEDWMVLDPAAHFYIAAYAVHNHFYDPLVEWDEQGNLVPMLAESWRSLDDRTWEFKLRKGVKFHNGEPFTAESVKFTLERIIDPQVKSAQAFLWAPLESVEVKDDYTAIIRTKSPFGPLLSTMTMTGILPAKAAKESGFFAKPAGTGAFRITRVLKGDRIELEANTDWWKGQPKLAKLTFRYIGEASTRVASLLGGETHVVDRVSPDVMRQIERSPRHRVATKRSVESQIIGFHCSKKPFADVRVRQAFNYGVDKQALVKDILMGHATVADAPMAPDVFGYAKQQPYPYDIAKAKALLKEAGYGEGPPEVELIVLKGVYTKGLEVSEAIAGHLAKIGAKVRVNDMEVARHREARAAGNFDFYFAGWATMTRDADFALWRNFHAGEATITGNQLRYVSKDVDKLIEQGQQTIDPQARKRFYAEAQRFIWQDAPWLFLYWPELIHGVDKRVRGFRQEPNNITLVRDAWLE